MAEQCNVIWAYPAPPVPLWRRVAERAAKAWRILVCWQRDYYELRVFLATKDDRLLRDMGVDRYDLRQELRRPFWDWAGRE